MRPASGGSLCGTLALRSELLGHVQLQSGVVCSNRIAVLPFIPSSLLVPCLQVWLTCCQNCLVVSWKSCTWSLAGASAGGRGKQQNAVSQS